MAEQDKNLVGDSKDVAKLENAVEVSFEFSMLRRRSLDEVRLSFVGLCTLVCVRLSRSRDQFLNLCAVSVFVYMLVMSLLPFPSCLRDLCSHWFHKDI